MNILCPGWAPGRVRPGTRAAWDPDPGRVGPGHGPGPGQERARARAWHRAEWDLGRDPVQGGPGPGPGPRVPSGPGPVYGCEIKSIKQILNPQIPDPIKQL